MELIIAANWKMHKTVSETIEFCRSLRSDEAAFSGVEVLICPPFTALAAAAEEMTGSPVKLGAQNMHREKQGAYTGEVSAPMLLEFGLEYVIVGHSERRHLMGEDDTLVAGKVEAAFASGLKPILCVGETEEEREQGVTGKVLERQLTAALENIAPENISKLVIAYEPVWAIGTGKAASAEDAENASGLIRNLVQSQFGKGAAAGLRIQYGGSVKAENIDSFVTLKNVDGALVGGASLEAVSFSALVQAARKAVRN